MKITIAYTSEEEREVGIIEAFIKGLMPGAKVKESDRHAPFKHIYLTIREPVDKQTNV